MTAVLLAAVIGLTAVTATLGALLFQSDHALVNATTRNAALARELRESRRDLSALDWATSWTITQPQDGALQ